MPCITAPGAPMMRRCSRLGVIPLLASLAGCISSSFNLATQKQDYTITSVTREVELGRKLARKVERQLSLVADESLQQRVKSLGARIVAVCDRKELAYTFAVIDDEDVNAFSLPGGYIYVNTGLVEDVAGDDELAGVLAHEVAHVTALHAVKRLEGRLGSRVAQLAALVSRDGDATRGFSIGLQAARLAYARQDELEADRLAVKYLRKAGFDPSAMLTFLEKLDALEDHRTGYMPRGIVRPQYAFTHPYVPERMRTVKEALFDVADYLDYINTSD